MSTATANGETPGEMITSPTAGPSRSDSVSSDTGIVYFAPNIVGESRVPATGDAVRDRCRELIAKAMMKGFEKGVCVCVCVLGIDGIKSQGWGTVFFLNLGRLLSASHGTQSLTHQRLMFTYSSTTRPAQLHPPYQHMYLIYS